MKNHDYRIHGGVGFDGCFQKQYYKCSFHKQCKHSKACKKGSNTHIQEKCDYKVNSLIEKYGVFAVQKSLQKILDSLSMSDNADK